MRKAIVTSFLAALLAAALPAAADEAAPAEKGPPPDPTRGQWDSVLDPLRDFEDNQVTATQKAIEDKTKIHVSAGFQEAWTWDFNTPPAGTALPYDGFLYHNDGTPTLFQIGASRPSEGWFIPGFGVKLDFGKVARRIKSDWDGDGAIDGDIFERNDFDAQEAYLTWAVPDDSPALKGLSVKGGKFVTLLGAEVVEPWANFNNSRSLLYTFAIPVTNTGVLLTYPITDKLSVTGGPVVGWDNVTTNNNGWTGMGNITYTATDKVSLAANGIWGPSQNGTTGPKRGVADFIATIKPTSELTLLLNYDWGQEQNAAIGGGTAIWQGFAAVANYAFTDRFSGAARGEFFNDFDGARTGIKQRVYEWTVDAKYLWTQHLYTQLEFRQDLSNKSAFQENSTGLAKNNPLVTINATYVFN
jgi:putative OmpL-like beta-barrel porin-2